MKLHDLISTTADQQTLAAVEAIDPNNIRGYEVVLRRLKSLQPAATEWRVVLGPPIDPEDNLLDIFGRKPGDPRRYAIEFNPWAEWLGMEVEVEGVDLTPPQMIAQCLYEMTFIGFDEDAIQEQREEIDRRVDEITDNLDDGDETTTAE
jgi:hypothetical protein